tara:strand:- start:3791 stop:3907 length:117 start_codon:yes stop_codon:yes gene_type:complete
MKIFKELAFVYIVDGKKFLCRKKAERYLRKLNKGKNNE